LTIDSDFHEHPASAGCAGGEIQKTVSTVFAARLASGRQAVKTARLIVLLPPGRSPVLMKPQATEISS
jgi:hypothetical protein